ncbi:MAG: HAD family hydrolase [Halolamina sp.]
MQSDPVVYDLDGTLVALPVDWAAARDDLAADLRGAGLEPGDRDLWDLLELAESTGYRDRFEAVVGGHEREAAREAPALPLADELRGHEGPTGVCSLNSEAACRIALDRHGLDADAVVGRDTVGSYKPDPAPLRAALSAMGVDGEAAVFVGDSERDRVTAERAGVRFQWVG